MEAKGIAIIGAGYWGPNHIRVMKSLLPEGIVMVVDQNEDQLARIRQQFPGTRTANAASEAFADPTIRGVLICTPTTTHFKLAKEALVAGKHVLCEKPLTVTAAEAEELRTLAERVGRVLMVGHVFLFNGGIRKLKELCLSESTGPLRYLAAVRTNLGVIRTDCNVSYDLASHDIAIFNWIMESEPETVAAFGKAFVSGMQEVAFLTLQYPNGAVGHIHASWLDPKKVRHITAVGTKRMMTWDDLNPTSPVAVYDKGAEMKSSPSDYGEFLRASMWDGDVVLPKVQLEEPLKVQDRSFLEAMDGGPVTSGGGFSVGVVRVLEAAERSLAQNGAPVRVVP